MYRFIVILFMVVVSYANDANLQKRDKLFEQAEQHYYAKEYHQALERFKEALNIEERLLGVHSDTALSYQAIAQTYKKLYDKDQAIVYLEKALAYNIKLLKSNDLKLAYIYNDLSLLYMDRANFKKALAYTQKALAIKCALPQKKSPKIQASIATSYNNLAELYRMKREYNKAYEHYQKALKIRQKVLGENHSLTAQSYENLASFYSELGSYQKALHYRQKALAIRQKTKDHLAESNHNLGRTYQKDGQYTKALEFFFRSLTLRTQSKKDQDWSATAYIYIAQIYHNQNRLDDALKYAQKALHIHQSILNEKSIYIATDYETLANIYYSQKKYQISLEHNTKALDIRKAILSDNIDTASSYYHLSRDYYKLNNYNHAIDYAFKALKIFMKNQKDHYFILTSQERRGYNKLYQATPKLANLFTIAHSYRLALSSHSKAYHELNQRLFNQWLIYKGRTSSKEDTISILYAKIKKLKTNIEELKASKFHLSTLYKTYPHKDERAKITSLEKSIKATQAKITRLELELNKTDKIFQELLALQDIDYQDITKRLQDNQVYIDFARVANHYYIFTLDNNAHITLDRVSLKDTKAIDSNITQFRAINSSLAKGEGLDIAKSKSNLAHLYNIIFKNYLNHHIDSKEYLIISPDGLLNFLPFEALYYNRHYLIEDKVITYIPSAKHLLYGYTHNKTANRGTDIVVFAHPDYYLDEPKQKNSTKRFSIVRNSNHFGSRLIDFGQYFQDLNGSLQEIATIQSLYPKAKIYRDQNATVANLLSLQSPEILHISTHGFFLEKASNEYLMHSGLLFAGANRARSLRDTQGIATALTLSTMDLTHTDLVVLSACDTGLGKIENAEGVLGLPKAFIQAGAKNI
ncbi:MAG: CHAT domain-containing tetratricopeptide repeat protein, partial [Campylobacterota bacterium]|nr:CHAT domain-containing tetratricopeptide repeat protein [Campylobacterota bacterium]